MSKEDFQACQQALLISDSNRNNLLEEDEFEKFVNRLSGNPTGNLGVHEKVHSLLSTTYTTILRGKNNEALSISGSKPGEAPTPKEVANLLM
jgi:hypothetical protein